MYDVQAPVCEVSPHRTETDDALSGAPSSILAVLPRSLQQQSKQQQQRQQQPEINAYLLLKQKLPTTAE